MFHWYCYWLANHRQTKYIYKWMHTVQINNKACASKSQAKTNVMFHNSIFHIIIFTPFQRMCTTHTRSRNRIVHFYANIMSRRYVLKEVVFDRLWIDRRLSSALIVRDNRASQLSICKCLLVPFSQALRSIETTPQGPRREAGFIRSAIVRMSIINKCTAAIVYPYTNCFFHSSQSGSTIRSQ